MLQPSEDYILAREVRRMLEAGYRISEIKVLLNVPITRLRRLIVESKRYPIPVSPACPPQST